MSDPIEPEAARFERDGSTILTVRVPPTPEFTRSLDAAYQRLIEWERVSEWYFTSLCEPSHSYGYICVMEKRAITHSMSGSASIAAAVAGWAATWADAIDDAIERARAHDLEHGAKEEAG